MSKFHINSKGKTAVCKATKKKCPYGGADGTENHFNSVEEAEAEIKRRMMNEFGIFPESVKKEKLTMHQRKDIAKLIDKESSSTTRGLTHECYATTSLAEQMGLENIAVIRNDGSIVKMSMNERRIIENDEEVPVSQAKDILSEHYQKQGVVINNKESLIRVIYYSKDPGKGVLVQTGSPNVLDAAIIKNGKVDELIEIKELSKGAQLSSKMLKLNNDGTIESSSLKGQMKAVKEKLANFNIKDAEKSNTVLDFGSDGKNKIYPLYQFIHQYKKKGANSLLYIADNGKVVNKISLEGDILDVAKNMNRNHISAQINMRANTAPLKATEADFERLTKDKTIFKEDVSGKETFTLSSVNLSEIRQSSGKVKIGSFRIESIDYKDFKLNMDKEISLSDIKAFPLQITGQVHCYQDEDDLRKLKEKEENERK